MKENSDFYLNTIYKRNIGLISKIHVHKNQQFIELKQFTHVVSFPEDSYLLYSQLVISLS